MTKLTPIRPFPRMHPLMRIQTRLLREPLQTQHTLKGTLPRMRTHMNLKTKHNQTNPTICLPNKHYLQIRFSAKGNVAQGTLIRFRVWMRFHMNVVTGGGRQDPSAYFTLLWFALLRGARMRGRVVQAERVIVKSVRWHCWIHLEFYCFHCTFKCSWQRKVRLCSPHFGVYYRFCGKIKVALMKHGILMRNLTYYVVLNGF